MHELLTRPVPELASLVARGEVSALELTDAALARIDALDENFGAFLSVAHDTARAAARCVDDMRRRGEPLGKLCGVPLAIKDALTTRDQPTTAGSRILCRKPQRGGRPHDAWQPPYDAHVVDRLRGAGAVLVGKTNMDELAMGSSNENSGFFPARNPWDTSRAPGGSSGGSAAAIAAGMVPGALGSDTGGSVRQPCSFTGTVGVKPTYGRASRYGLIAFASSLDQVGPMANDVRGAALLLECIAGYDERDSTSAAREVPDYVAACEREVRGLRIGVPEEYFAAGLASEVEAAVRDAVAALERAGASVEPVTLPHTRYAVATYYIVATAECSSNLARFDGVRFGLRSESTAAHSELASLYRDTRRAGFGSEVKRRILLGTYVLSAGYFDAYYLRAQRARTLIAADFAAAFARVDAIATPVSPTVAFKLGERVDDPLAMYLADVYTLPASLAGVPALSVPCGLGSESGMPVGLQLIGPAFSEAALFSLASAVERAAPSRGVRPPEPSASHARTRGSAP